MSKNDIIKHYRDYFDLHAKGILLDEDDHLNIDWAEDLIKNLPIPLVVFSEAELKAKLEQQLEETRQWLIDEDFEGLAERL